MVSRTSVTNWLPLVWGCLKTDLFSTRHRVKCLNSCFGAQTDRKFYSCPAEEYISSMLFLILLYPNSNMENKTRKKKTKIISIHQAGPWLFPDLSSFWRSVLAAADMVSVGLACSWCLLMTSAGLGCVSSRSSPPRWRCSVSWRNIHSTMNSGKKFFRTACLTMLQKTKH